MIRRKTIVITPKAYNSLMALKKAKEKEGDPSSAMSIASSIIVKESERLDAEA